MSVDLWANEIVNGKGYVLLPDLLSKDQVEEARSLTHQLAQVERSHNKTRYNDNRERVYALVYKGKIFETIVQHPTVLEIVAAILGDFVLGGFSAHILYPGATPMGVHVDYPYFTLPQPYPAYPILEIQAIWLVDDFTENNGAVAIAPHTQKYRVFPSPEEFAETAKKITGRPGSVILSHGLCWHNTSENTSDQSRISLLGNYTPKFVRPIENPLQDFQQEVYDDFSPQLQQMLCLDFQKALFG